MCVTGNPCSELIIVYPSLNWMTVHVSEVDLACVSKHWYTYLYDEFWIRTKLLKQTFVTVSNWIFSKAKSHWCTFSRYSCLVNTVLCPHVVMDHCFVLFVLDIVAITCIFHKILSIILLTGEACFCLFTFFQCIGIRTCGEQQPFLVYLFIYKL